MRKQITSLPPKPQPSHTSPLKLRHHPNSKECKRFRRKTSKGHMTHFKKKNKVFIFDQTILMHLNICIKCYHLVQITVECHFWIPSMNKNVEIIALIINRKKKKVISLIYTCQLRSTCAQILSVSSVLYIPSQMRASSRCSSVFMGWAFASVSDNGVELE